MGCTSPYCAVSSWGGMHAIAACTCIGNQMCTYIVSTYRLRLHVMCMSCTCSH